VLPGKFSHATAGRSSPFLKGLLKSGGPRERGSDGLRTALCITALLATFPALHLLHPIWERTEYLGHGYLIPVAAALLVWERREALREALLFGIPPRSGPFCVLLAALLQSAIVAAQVASAAALGIACLLGAAAYALSGGVLLRLLSPALGFLLFMAPPPIFMRDRVLLALKAWVIEGSVQVLQALEVPVAALGARLILPEQELFVADACSGLNSVVTLLPLAVIVAHFASHGLWRRAVIIASTVPLAVAGNSARVIATVALVHGFGVSYAESWLHGSLGMLTLGLGSLALLGLARALR
jgi:exosortase